jgi:hairy-and-enhancer-of-split protein
LLERQRRARINRCLDELKEILVSGLQSEGENVARLEKADILELTVRHLQKLQQQHNKMIKAQQTQGGDDERFRGGFAHCAAEVSRVLATTRGVDIQLGSSIMVHLGHSLNQITTTSSSSSSTSSSPAVSPRLPRPSSVCSSSASSSGDYRPYTPPASPTESHFSQLSPLPLNMTTNSISSKSNPWRPW